MTSRLADCGGATVTFGRLRANHADIRDGSAGFGYFAGPAPVVIPRSAWLERLRAQLMASDGRVLVYIHGYNNDFGQATDRARELRDLSAFTGPVIAFSWPSQAKIRLYTWDEENAVWTQPYFEGLLLALLREPGVKEIVLVAHSMGNRVALRSLFEAGRVEPELVAGKIRNLILASPDVDRAIFERDYVPMLDRPNRRTTIYVSRSDRALRASWVVHGHVRTGDSGCHVNDLLRGRRRHRCFAASLPPPPSNISVVETSLVRGSGLGHSDFVENEVVRADLCRVLNDQQVFPERDPAGGSLTNVFFLIQRSPAPAPCRTG